MRFLITAGPTREYLDDVRYFSNGSSGRMGYAIAAAALKKGHEVILVSGPVAIHPPKQAHFIPVISTDDMYKACAEFFPQADCLIGAAAPADYTPVHRARGKMKKSEKALSLRLKPTIDILATLGKRKKPGQILISFALEAQSPVRNALAKMKKKNADAVLLNSPAAIGASHSSAHILLAGGDSISLQNASKDRIARTLVSLAEKLRSGWR